MRSRVYQPRFGTQVPPLALAHLPAFVVGSRGIPVVEFCATAGTIKAITEQNTIHPNKMFRKIPSLKFLK
jgi:hypothetical protein